MALGGAALGTLTLGLGCGRDFSLPQKAVVLPLPEPEPELLGELAGTYQGTVKREVSVKDPGSSASTRFQVSVPVSAEAIVQHMAFEVLGSEGKEHGAPLVIVLVPPDGLDPSNNFGAASGRGFLLTGLIQGNQLVSRSVWNPGPGVNGSFNAELPAGGGLMRLGFDACPGLPVFELPEPLQLERGCRFEASRSGVYTGCFSACGGGCDPVAGVPETAIALGFAPIGKQGLDLVVGTAWWTGRDQPWTRNISVGVYDHFLGRGLAVAQHLDDGGPRPVLFALERRPNLLDLEWDVSAALAQPYTNPFVAPPQGTLQSIETAVPATTCAERRVLQRLAGGGEERCALQAPSSILTLSADVRRELLRNLVAVTATVPGVGALIKDPLQDWKSFEYLADLAGIHYAGAAGTSPLSDYLEIRVRTPTGALPQRANCPVGVRATACFDLPRQSPPTAVVVEGELRVQGSREVCPDWPSDASCAPDQRVPKEVVLPLAVALPQCLVIP